MTPAGQTVGRGYMSARGDPLPELTPLAGLRAGPATDYALLASLAGLPIEEVQRRVSTGNRPYLAWIDETPVGYGWSGAGGMIGPGSGRAIPSPAGSRWLWDFATLPAWRGRGVYPRLLQAILAQEGEATRFFIGHRVDNTASQQGILKAGFRHVANTVLTRSGELNQVSAEDGQPISFM